MLIGELTIYAGLILTLVVVITKMFFVLVKKEFKIYLKLLRGCLWLFLVGAVILGAGRIIGF